MNMLDMISEPVLFAQEAYEHSRKVYQIVKQVPLLMEALLSQDFRRIRAIREDISKMRDETIQIKLSLYDRIKDMHFHSPGAYAFSQFLACQDGIAGSSLDFADVLTLREITIPVELQAGFKAFAAQVVDVCERAMTPAEVFSSETEAIPAEDELKKALNALRGVTESNKQAKRLGVRLIQRVQANEEQLGWSSTMFIDKCCAALQKLADDAEHTGDHLRLIFPQT
jgi:uncharacterized protein